MTRILLTILAASIWFYSCKNESPKNVGTDKGYIYVAPLNDKTLVNKLISQAIDSGNENAYNRIASYHLLENQGEEFLYFAIKFANKYNSAEACYHVYDILVHPRNGERLNNLDPLTKNLAKYYLLKSYEMGYLNSKFEVEEIFGDSAQIPKSLYYLEEFVNANK